MKESPNPLEYHYDLGVKLDYFILSVDIALLGWTVLNVDWLPRSEVYRLLITAFWFLLVLSIICGIIRQLYNSMIFSLNYHFLHEAEQANRIEKASINGGFFVDQATGKVSTADEFKKHASQHRMEETIGREKYTKYSKLGMIFANLTTIFLVVALVLLVLVRISLL